MSYWPHYLLLGAVVGFLAGLLGIGGGIIIISFLLILFAQQGFLASQVMHLALGTSMACILFGSLSSLRAHHGHGAVNWSIVRRLTPGILVGGFLATFVAARLSSTPLKVIFVTFQFYMAINMFRSVKPKPSRQLPGTLGMTVAGTAIGALSSLVGIGGAAISIPFMTWCNVKMHDAIGTSAAIGFPVALFGTLGFIVNGWHIDGLPAGSLGFVYLPAMVVLSAASMLAAPFGAKVSHRLPVPTLKRVFGILLVSLGSAILYKEFF